MDEQNSYQDLLYAYAIGCLDKEDLILMDSYLNSPNAQIDWQALGEYQNLIALLPAILNIESPSTKLKDAVALKLYKINSAKRSKKIIPASKSEAVNRNENDEEEKIIPEHISLNIDDDAKSNKKVEENIFEKETESISPYEHNAQVKEEENDALDLKKSIPPNEENNNKSQKQRGTSEQSRLIRERILNQAAKEEKKHKNFLIYLLLFLFIAAVATLAVLYNDSSKQVNYFKNHVADLRKTVIDFSSKLDEDQNILRILQSKDVNIINLTASKINPEGSGKIIMSLSDKKGFLQLLKIPALPDSEAYQLWARIKGSYISLGLFNPNNETNIYPFSLPELSNSGISFFLLTKSPASGTNKPNSEVYFIGVQK